MAVDGVPARGEEAERAGDDDDRQPGAGGRRRQVPFPAGDDGPPPLRIEAHPHVPGRALGNRAFNGPDEARAEILLAGIANIAEGCAIAVAVGSIGGIFGPASAPTPASRSSPSCQVPSISRW